MPMAEPENNYGNVSPVSSPTRDPSRVQQRKVSSMGSPLSPRSPRGSPKPSSPKKSPHGSSRTPRSTSQYLHSVRQKIPVILKALCYEPESVMDYYNAAGAQDNGDGMNPSLVDFSIPRRMVDALGLIVCGGYSRDQQATSLSVLHPMWTMETEGNRSSRDMTELMEHGSSSIAFSELTSWINLHLSMNDIIYPVSNAPAMGSMPSSPTKDSPGSGLHNAMDIAVDPNMDNAHFHRNHQNPTRAIYSLTSLSRFIPTVINGCSTTVIHGVTTGPSRTASLRRINSSRSQDAADHQHHTHELKDFEKQYSYRSMNELFENDGDAATHNSESTTISDGLSDSGELDHRPLSPMLGGTDSKKPASSFHGHLFHSSVANPSDRMEDASQSMDEADLAKYDLSGSDAKHSLEQGFAVHSRPELTLPQFFINFCKKSQVYLLSPYYSGSINGCESCEIVIGAVYGAIIVDGCEKVKITGACRKLIILNCLECEFNVATLSPTIISGDSRALTFGPYNTTYRNLKHHLKLTELQQLQSTALDIKNNVSSNYWASFCDVNSSVETTVMNGSPSGYAMDAAVHSTLPTAPITIAGLLAPEKFRPIAVPFKSEYLSFDYCPIAPPAEYADHLKFQQESVFRIKNQINTLINDKSKQIAASATGDKKDDSSDVKLAASTLITKKFMEWLIASDNAQHVLDLIRIDSEKSSGTQH